MPVSSEQQPSAFCVHLRRTKQGHEAPVKQLSAGVSGVDMYDRICFKLTIGITKKEQDNSCSYIQRGAKRQKKASVPIQLSGWLRTLALVRISITDLTEFHFYRSRTAHIQAQNRPIAHFVFRQTAI